MSQHPQSPGPMQITVPPSAPSNPDTPSEMPGTPTSTTTSLSALSTTAIKDGHRGHGHPGWANPTGSTSARGGHGHQTSITSLEAERADRISRLAGLERVSTLRAGANHPAPASTSPLTTPTSGFFPSQSQQGQGQPTVAYFDSNGQPTALTKMSTVGTASATGSVGARTTTEAGDHFDMDTVDEDGMSTSTNYRTMDVDSVSGGGDAMDEDMTNRSVGGYEDHMSDDGTASLVGFGEGANSTVSGPIYHRRPLPSGVGAASGVWNLERSSSGLSDNAMLRNREMRDAPASSDTPISSTAAAERREARYVDGVSMDGGGHVGTADDEIFVDTTTQGPIPVQPGQPRTSALREGVGGPATREAAERMVRERLDHGESSVGEGGRTLVSAPGSGDKLGQFYFEDRK